MRRLRLFCLPYAGASAMIYRSWQGLAPSWLELSPVEIPGRGRRSHQPFAVDLASLSAELANELGPRLTGDYALFGHSLGAVLAFELTHGVRDLGLPPPVAVFASGSESPHQRNRERFSRLRSDAELIGEMRRLDGTPAEVFESPELLELSIPILRADFALVERYEYVVRPPLASALHVFAGDEDEFSREQMQAWKLHASRRFTLDFFEGGHFFIHAHRARVLELVARYAQEALEDCSGEDGRSAPRSA